MAMRRVAAVVTVLGLAAAAATAGVVLRVTPRELADTAHVVVEGRVDSVEARWNDDRSAIHTWTTLVVDRVHKGVAGGTVAIKVPGGVVGDEELRVDGTARFEPGERCMVFLWKDRHGDYQVLGEAQGRFVLTDDGRGGVRMAENSLRGLCLVARGDPKTSRSPSLTAPDRLPHEDLVAVVRASVAGERPSPSTTTKPVPGTPRPDVTDTDDDASSGPPSTDGSVTSPPETTSAEGGEGTVAGDGSAPPDATTQPAGEIAPAPSPPAGTVVSVVEDGRAFLLRVDGDRLPRTEGARYDVVAPDGTPRGVVLVLAPTEEQPLRAVRIRATDPDAPVREILLGDHLQVHAPGEGSPPR